MLARELFFPHLALSEWELVQKYWPDLGWGIKARQIASSAKIATQAVIENGVIIGENVEIRPFALIRAGSIIADGCVIGHGAEIKNSYLGSGSKVQGRAFVGDSILGCGVRIGTGAVLSNRRFDQKEIAWQLPNDQTLFSGRDKAGAVLGDYVRIGANTVLNPGVTIGAFTWVAGLQNISGHLGRGLFIKADGKVVTNKHVMALKAVDQYDNR